MTLIYSALLIWATWIFYLAIMSLRRHKDQMSLPAKIIGYPTLFVGVVLDVLINWLVGTVVFVAMPKELLLTARLKRHIREGGWRATMARWVCHNFLNVFDPGGSHC